MIYTPSLNSHNPDNLDTVGPILHQHPMAAKKMMIQMGTDKSCWTCKYLGNWKGGTFIQDFTCNWFPKHGKGEKKKIWPQKDPDEGCKFWELRKQVR